MYPHGSNFRFLLSGKCDMFVFTYENPIAFQFCDSYHDRGSILSNSSFDLHREHIGGDPLKGIPGTSCYTCHASHASRTNQHLIEFNRDVVLPDKNTSRILYSTNGFGSGECSLNCHGHNHSSASYSVWS